MNGERTDLDSADRLPDRAARGRAAPVRPAVPPARHAAAGDAGDGRSSRSRSRPPRQRLERYRIPRPVGALLDPARRASAALALVIYLLIPPFVDQTNQFVDDVPAIVKDLEKVYADVTGQSSGEVGDKVQRFVERYTDEPDRLIGPLTSIGLNVAGILGALVLILITAYYMAIRPEPLVNGLDQAGAAAAPRARAPRARPHPPVVDRLDAGRGDRHARDGRAAVRGAHDRRPRLRDLLRRALGAARGGALLRRDRRRDPADAVRAHRLARQGAPRARRLHPRAAAREQRDDPGHHGPARPAAPGRDRDRRRGGRPAVRLRRPVRGRADPLADHHRRGGVLGEADRGGPRRGAKIGARAARPARASSSRPSPDEAPPLRPAS